MKKWTLFSSTAQSPNGNAESHEPEILPVITAADAKMFGLENFGNTCYANSVLQALYFCGPFRELLVQYPDASQPDVSLISTSVTPIPPPTSPPQNHQRPKPGRKQSVSDPAFIPSTPVINNMPVLSMPPAPPSLLSALRSLYLHISQNPAEKGTVAPRAFIDKLKELNELFRSTMHQDAHEFLNYLLNQIVEEMDEDRKKFASANGHPHTNDNGPAEIPTHEDLSASIGSISVATNTTGTHMRTTADFVKSTLVHRLFEGTLTSETRCLTCETVSSRDESFLDLSIDIEQNSSVTACLRQFSASEMLCQRDKFFCDSCCDLQEAEKRMKIKKLPNILALHLKRFKYQEDVGKYIKLAYRVAFPLELRLFNTTDGTTNPDRLYELFAIVVHIGSGPHHGHYVSIVKARGTWYLFDDDKIDAIKETEIPKYYGDSNSGSAYVLYYQAADLDHSALGLRPAGPELQSVSTSTAYTNLTSSSSLSDSGALTPTAENDSKPAILTTPASPILPLPPGLSIQSHQNSPLVASSPTESPQVPRMTEQPSLVSNTPSPTSIEPSFSPPTAPPTPSGSSNTRGFFNSLRHSPSLRIRPTSSSERKSLVTTATDVLPPVPPLPDTFNNVGSSSSSSTKRPSTAGSADTRTPPMFPIEPVPSLPLPPSISATPSVSTTTTSHPTTPTTTAPVIKEKDKSSASSWVKMKSLLGDKDKHSVPHLNERSVSVGGNGNEDTLSSSSSSASPPSSNANGSNGLMTFKRVSRRASDAVIATSHHHHSVPATQLLFSPPPIGQSSLRPVPEHNSRKHSTPEVVTMVDQVAKEEKKPQAAAVVVQRPLTAGGALERKGDEVVALSPPLPPPLPLPSLPTSSLPPSFSDPQAATADTGDSRVINPLGANGVQSISLPNHIPDQNHTSSLSSSYRQLQHPPPPPTSSHHHHRPHTLHAPSSFSAFEGVHAALTNSETAAAGSSPSATSTSTSTPTSYAPTLYTSKGKRASRKLSFSSAMLGFVKKDKDKDKDKDREKEKEKDGVRLNYYRSQSPAYSQTSSQGTGSGRV